MPSPDAEITNVPAEVLPLYAYGVVQPEDGVGSVAMNGPAVCSLSSSNCSFGATRYRRDPNTLFIT